MRASYGTSSVPYFIWRETDEKVPEWATRQPSTLRLIPLNLDINHGYAKEQVVNSEVAKRQAAAGERVHHLEQWASDISRDTCKSGHRAS